MKIDQIQYFLTIANTHSISKAAASLGISQQSLSSSMQTLEQGLGVELLKRSNKGVALTNEGECFRSFALEVRDAYDQLLIEIGADDIFHEIERLRIGVMDAITTFLPTFLVDFIPRHPYINLRVFSYSVEEILEKLEAGNLDCGLILRMTSEEKEVPVIKETLSVRHLAACRSYCWMSMKSPLVLQSNVSIKQMLDHPLVLRETTDMDFLDLYFGDMKYQLLDLPLVDHDHMIAEAVAHNLAMCPDSRIGNRELMMARDFSSLPVVAKPIRLPASMAFEACIVTTEGSSEQNAVQVFMEQLSRYAGNTD